MDELDILDTESKLLRSERVRCRFGDETSNGEDSLFLVLISLKSPAIKNILQNKNISKQILSNIFGKKITFNCVLYDFFIDHIYKC